MIKTTIVAFLLTISTPTSSQTLSSEINTIESQWAQLYYAENNSAQKVGYPKLLKKTGNLLKKHPKNAELMIWHAILTSTNAAYQGAFTALNSVNIAKKQLELAIKTKPYALEGAAYVALGTLYHMLPGWPISFGDEYKAEKLLKTALKINPQGIDSNYFYADYLLSQDDYIRANQYFNRALNAPTRPEQQFADQQLKKEALSALHLAKQRKLESGKNKFFSLFTSASSN